MSRRRRRSWSGSSGCGDRGRLVNVKSRLKKASLALLGIAAFLVVGILLEEELGIGFYTTYRVGCAAACLFLIFRFASDYPGERWPWLALLIATLVNVGIFFTPLVAGPASRGEIMVFAAPDAVIVLAARAISYSAIDAHQRAVHGQLIVGLILVAAFCAIILAGAFVPPRGVAKSKPIAVMKTQTSVADWYSN